MIAPKEPAIWGQLLWLDLLGFMGVGMPGFRSRILARIAPDGSLGFFSHVIGLIGLPLIQKQSTMASQFYSIC
jgi:hypothetical protein